jgi:tetratricopeptide (TPR) repeat protein
LQQSLEDRKKAQAADQKARSSQSQAQVAEIRATSEAGKSEEAIKAAATETILRQRAEANLNTTISNFITRLAALPPPEALKAATVLFTAQDEKQPWAAQLLPHRGEWRARQGDWTNAMQDFSKALDLDLGDQDSYHALVPLLVQDENWEAYGTLRSLYLARFGRTNDPAGAPLLAADWLLKPFPTAEGDVAEELAGTGAGGESNGNQPPQRQLAMGLADYRAGHFAAALDLTQKAVAGSAQNPACNAQACATLAMIQLRLKQPDEARATWAKGEKIAEAGIARLAGGDPGPDWRDWIVAHALLQEATGLILPAATGK